MPSKRRAEAASSHDLPHRVGLAIGRHPWRVIAAWILGVLVFNLSLGLSAFAAAAQPGALKILIAPQPPPPIRSIDVELTAIHQGPALVIAPQGRLDSTTAPAFEKQLLEHLAGQSNLILDFSALDFISSAGLRVLLMAAKRIGKDNGRFLLCEVSQPVREVLEISGFLGMIEVVGSRDEALAEMPS